MYKNQLQELAQRSCFNLPSYSCIREGPDHAPRFKSTVTFNGESFESPGFCNTLRQAEHAAAEVALNTLSMRGPSQSLAARILDETGVCKNLLQETAQRAGVNIPVYSVTRSGPGHMPVFVSTVEVAGMSFVGESAKTKKQAEKNAAMAAWASLKQLVIQGSASSQSPSCSYANEEQLQIVIGRALMKAAQENHAAPRTEGPPIVPRPVPNSRIRITPFEECLGQETINLQMPAAQTSVGAKADPTAGHEQGVGSLDAINRSSHDSFSESSFNSAPRNSTAVSRMMTSESCSFVGQRSPQVHTFIINPGTDSQMTLVPINQFQQDDPNWFQSGTSTIILTNSKDASSSDSGFPSMQAMYTPVMRNNDNGQYMNTVSAGGRVQPTNLAFIPTSLAPRVRVRQTVPVCSAPPRSSEPEDGGMNTTESATRQSLADLKL